MTPVSIGTAGWTIPRECAYAFSGERRHLQRYARAMRCVEIDSSFYRPHRLATYARWASETPDGFRFAVKLPRAITHDARLVDVDGLLAEMLATFLGEVAGLGDKLGVLLVQLPPSLVFDDAVVTDFFATLRALHDGGVVCEPRHASWFSDAADRTMRAARIGRVAADPALSARAAEPGGWRGPADDGRGAILYWRWHGSPRMYWSAYADAWLSERADMLSRVPHDADAWVIFDNTGAGAALANALTLRAFVDHQPAPLRAAVSRAIVAAPPR